MSKEAAGKSALILHTVPWMAADVIRVVKTDMTVAGILKTPVWNQLEYGHATHFVVGRPD